MRWVWVMVTVLGGTLGDLMTAKGMAMHGEIEDMGPQGLARIVRYMATHKLVLGGMGAEAVSFIGMMALLATTELAFAVPVTALSNILKTALAHWYLGEKVTWKRWAGAILVGIGIVLISI